MRYGEDHKEKTHAKIVERASQEFREHGFEGIGIASLMSQLGLSHGGFYAHFEDKEDLKDQAMEHALNQSLEIALDALRRGGVPAYIELYTGDLHRDHPGKGCILATLCAEEARRAPESKAKFALRLQENVELLVDFMPGTSRAEQKDHVLFLLSTLSGAVALARASGDSAFSGAILRSTREHLTQFFRGL